MWNRSLSHSISSKFLECFSIIFSFFSSRVRNVLGKCLAYVTMVKLMWKPPKFWWGTCESRILRDQVGLHEQTRLFSWRKSWSIHTHNPGKRAKTVGVFGLTHSLSWSLGKNSLGLEIHLDSMVSWWNLRRWHKKRVVFPEAIFTRRP